MTTLVPNGVADPNLDRTFTGMIFDHSKDKKKKREKWKHTPGMKQMKAL